VAVQSVPTSNRARTTMRPPLDVGVSRGEGTTVVRARGELDMGTVPVLRRATTGRRGPVVLDLREVEFIDAAGLRLLLELDALSRQDGFDLLLVPGRVVERLLGLTGVRGRFTLREHA
jgi:anti-anti-sigma factor